MRARVRIVLNGEEREVPEGTTVAALVDAVGIDRRYVAVERNLEIVPRARHEETLLAPGDRIEIVTMVGGG